MNQDMERAIASYKGACDRGEPTACARIAFIYRRGKGKRRSRAPAAEFYGKTCDVGAADECNELGYMYVTGRSGVAADERRALALFRRACDARHATGCGDPA